MEFSFISNPFPNFRRRDDRARVRQRPLIPVCAKKNGEKPNRLPSGKGFSKASSEGKVGFVGSDTIGISFTCNADSCNQRVTKTIKRKSYEQGTVLIQCPSCNKHHIIADNMGMYTHLTGGRRNVEEIAKDAGVNVSRVSSSTFNLEKLVSKVIDDSSEDGGGTLRSGGNSELKGENQGQTDKRE